MEISVVLSTYNRAEHLARALESLARQVTSGIDYEIVVVNNNSTDNTEEVVRSFIERDPHFQYVFERRQGLSYGRNAGIAAARADLVVFTDDDIEFSPSWIQQNYEASLAFPEADYFGGRVLPRWSGPVPSWAKCSMDPFALSDLGDKPVRVSLEQPDCLVGASLAVRRRALRKAGLFNTATQRVKNSIGSTEDWDWEVKVWNYGGHGMYVPNVVCYTEVPQDRLTKSYHRRWHFGNGKFHAISRRPELQGGRRIAGVPLFLYRQGLQSAWDALRHVRDERAFSYELRFWYHLGVIRHGWSESFNRLRSSTRFNPSAGESAREPAA